MNDNRRSGFKNWDGAPVQDLKFLNAGFDGWGDNSIAWLSYNAKLDKAFIISGKFATKYEAGGGNKIGAAMNERTYVTADSVTTAYQNFENGYMKSVDGADCEVVNVKNVVIDGTTVTEEDIATDAAGYFGAADSNFPLPSTLTYQQLSEKFTSAYDTYATAGFDVGQRFTMLGDIGGFYAQSFRNGSSVADPWDDAGRKNWSYLAWNSVGENVVLLKDEFMRIFEKKPANWDKLGAPMADNYYVAAKAKRYQNFMSGYAVADGATPQNVNPTVVIGKNIDEDGNETEITHAEWIGKPDSTITTQDGVTPAQIGEKFVAKYGEIVADYTKVVPTGLISKENGVIRQAYTATPESGKEQTVAIAYDTKNKAARFMSQASYESFTVAKDLGYPNTDVMKVAEGGEDSAKAPAVSVQGFEKGYVKIVITESFELVDGEFVSFFTEKGTATLGATYNADLSYFENINYKSQVGALSGSLADVDPHFNVPTGEALTKLFQDAYQAAWDQGFSCGAPDNEGVVWWTTGQNGIVKLSLTGGNGTANMWDKQTMLIYDADAGIVRMMTGGIGTTYASGGASGNGYPITDMMVDPETGTIIQNFHSWDTVVGDRYVHFVLKNGDSKDVEKKDGTIDFASDEYKGYVPYMSQFSSSYVTLKTFTPKVKYDIGEAISIDLKTLLNNPSKFTVKFDTTTAVKGTLSADGIFTYTGTEKEYLSLNLVMYTAFEKIEFKATLNIGNETADKTALTARYNELKDTEQGSYDKAKFEAFTASLNAAKATIDNASASQAQVDAALADLNAKYDDLTKTPGKKGCGAGFVGTGMGGGMIGGLGALMLTAAAAVGIVLVTKKKTAKAV